MWIRTGQSVDTSVPSIQDPTHYINLLTCMTAESTFYLSPESAYLGKSGRETVQSVSLGL
jgi:hypothetical protein